MENVVSLLQDEVVLSILPLLHPFCVLDHQEEGIAAAQEACARPSAPVALITLVVSKKLWAGTFARQNGTGCILPTLCTLPMLRGSSHSLGATGASC